MIHCRNLHHNQSNCLVMKKIYVFIILIFYFYKSYSQNYSETNLSGNYSPILKVVGHGQIIGINLSHRTPILGNTGSLSTNSNTAGVVGYSANSTTSNVGVLGFANGNSSNENVGVLGQANLNNAVGVGSRGKVFSNSNVADYLIGGDFISETSSGVNGSATVYGLKSYTFGNGQISNSYGLSSHSTSNITGNSYGIRALSNASGTGSEYGASVSAIGTSTGFSKIGLLATVSGLTSVSFRTGIDAAAFGPASQSSIGIQALADNSGNGITYGGFFEAKGTGTGVKCGLYVTASGDGPKYAAIFDGSVGIGSFTPNAPLQFASTIANRKIVMYEFANNDHQYVGFGVNGNALRYQVDVPNGSHIFYAASNASASTELMRVNSTGLGIGVNPAEKLHIDGNIRASSLAGTGVRDVKADANGNLTTTAAQTKYYSASNLSFVMESTDGTSNANYFAGMAYGTSGNNELKCPLVLPHGAVVSNIKIYYSDNSAGNDLTFSMERTYLPNAGGMYGSAVSSSGSSGSVLSIDIPVNFTVNNQNNTYFVNVAPKTGGSVWINSSALCVRSVVVTYSE